MRRPGRRRIVDDSAAEEVLEDPGRSCVKCGGVYIFGPNFHRTQLECESLSLSRKQHLNEHLHFQCKCGYDWTEGVNTAG